MAIEVIDIIRPKNNAFVGIVDASQVLGGAGNNLPDNALKASNVTQFTEEIQDIAGGIATSTNSITLTYTDLAATLTADLKIQNTATVTLSVDASGLKADAIAASSGYRQHFLLMGA